MLGFFLVRFSPSPFLRFFLENLRFPDSSAKLAIVPLLFLVLCCTPFLRPYDQVGQKRRKG